MDYSLSSESTKVYAEFAGQHVSLGRSVRFLVWLIPTAIVGALVTAAYGKNIPHIAAALAIFGFIWGVFVSGIRVAAQWERGVVLRLGKFHCVKGPGIIYIIPVIDFVRFVDTRVLAINIPRQKVITKDNVPAEIDGALFFFVADAGKAITEIQDYQYAISQYAQASLRDVVGGLNLDEVLSERHRIQDAIGQAIEARIKDWGVHVDSIRLLDIEMPEDLKRMMSRQASAEREKRATITKAEGDKLAAMNLAEAAATMATSPGAMQLRTLQTIDGLGPSPSNTVIMFPVELQNAFKSIAESFVRNTKKELDSKN